MPEVKSVREVLTNCQVPSMALELAWTSFPSSPYLCYPLSPLSVVESSSASSVPSSFHTSWIWKAKGPGPRDSSTHNGVQLRGRDTAVQMYCIFSDSSWTQIRTMEVREVARGEQSTIVL